MTNENSLWKKTVASVALLTSSAGAYFAGDLILSNHPAHPANFLGSIGLVLVFGSILCFMGGFGEGINLLVEMFRRGR